MFFKYLNFKKMFLIKKITSLFLGGADTESNIVSLATTEGWWYL